MVDVRGYTEYGCGSALSLGGQPAVNQERANLARLGYALGKVIAP